MILNKVTRKHSAWTEKSGPGTAPSRPVGGHPKTASTFGRRTGLTDLLLAEHEQTATLDGWENNCKDYDFHQGLSRLLARRNTNVQASPTSAPQLEVDHDLLRWKLWRV